MDVSTGEFFATELDDFSSVCSEIQNLKAREVVVGYDLPEADEQVLVKQLNLLLSKETEVYDDVHLIDTSLTDLESSVAGNLLQYVHRTQMRELSHLQKAQHYEIKDYLQMSYTTKSSLDLLENARTGKKHGSLFWLLDETKTAMGMRLLRTWIDRPLVNQTAIMERQNIIQVFLDNFFERSDLTESLKGVYDIERLASRVSFGKANPKDLIQLGHTLAQVPVIKAILESFNDEALSRLLQELDTLPELESLIRSAIDPDAPATITEGGIIRAGFDETLDKYRKVMSEGTSWIADIEAKEREASGITTLKIDYNRKDGYYFHVTNSNLSLVPDHFFRKATLKNSERFGTAELAKIEGEMLEAREKSSSSNMIFSCVSVSRLNAILTVCNLWLRPLRQSMCFRVWQLQQRLIIMFVLCSMMSIVLLLIKVVMRWLRRLWAFRNTFQTRLPLTVRPMFSSSQDQI